MIHTLEKAATMGDIPCMAEFGERLLRGEGVKKDEERGVMYLEGAADKGHSEAMLSLATYFLKVEQ